jgi:hypothetical protein
LNLGVEPWYLMLVHSNLWCTSSLKNWLSSDSRTVTFIDSEFQYWSDTGIIPVFALLSSTDLEVD